ncbi:magnesium transporter CorA family protein [Piscinibacter sakaiensis]|uniref:Magnesium and cobalt transport protein CorA n=1 Tax=Piscinibacter sakaiensis TaxID=1547922 RepID=A0A0K8P4V2_PISS1|nr:magnesium transporter CorA family protein [Piscinibacter sakaiensis]GAP37569.1 magnesium and cobalt transport protein CorA [Piscinibacter sakaiensis]
MRVFHVDGEQALELADLPASAPAEGWLWVGVPRGEFGQRTAEVQAALQRWTGSALVDLHVSDLLNEQLPSHFESTTWYDLLVFRRLAAGARATEGAAAPARTDPAPAAPTLEAIDTSPVGFVLFDRVLLSVHPDDCVVRDFFAGRMAQATQATDPRVGTRLPPSAADLMLRMVNHVVDGYLALRRLLTRQLGQLQQALFDPKRRLDWQVLLASRDLLHQLEDTCEDQRAAIVEWIDALEEWPPETDEAARRERELLRVRSRDVLEHVERVLSHVRRLEGSAETAVQMHFSAQGDRTNQVMRTLTVLTAIFLPLNLVTGFFGMNFDGLPLVHTLAGFWIVVGLLVGIGVSLSWFFWRKRYLGTH